MSILNNSRLFGIAFIAAIIAVFLNSTASYIDGRIWPVVEQFKITAGTSERFGWTEVSGEFEKERECTFDHLEWYWRGDNIQSRVVVEFPYSINRNNGKYLFSNWLVQMPVDQLKGNSVIEVYHSCYPYLPSFKTITHLYP